MVRAELVRTSDLRSQEFERAALVLIESKPSPHTRKAYKGDLRRWTTFCASLGVDPMRPGLPATTNFRSTLTESMGSASVRRVLSALSFIYRELLKVNAVTLNPFHQSVLPWPRVSRSGKTTAAPDDAVVAMIANASSDKDRQRGLRDAALLRLLFDTGLRRESVATLTRAAWIGKILHVRVKGGVDETVELPAITQEALRDWLRVASGSAFLFAGARGGHIHPNTINKIVTARARAVGAEGIHPHCFRTAFVTTAYDLQLPEREIQGAAHHAHLSSTRGYDRGARGSGVAEAISTWRLTRKRGPDGSGK